MPEYSTDTNRQPSKGRVFALLSSVSSIKSVFADAYRRIS